MLEVLNWYAEHPVLGTIALMLCSGAVLNAMRFMMLMTRGK